jgi:EAL domain-containing protein (putative c-di-GMP-specific phosphodiesterase class I)
MIYEDALMSGCPNCGVLPEKIAGAGRLHLWLASRHSAKKLRVYLSRDRHWAYENTEDGRVLIYVDRGAWDTLMANLSDLFSSSELDAAKALCKFDFDEPTLADFPNVRSLRQLIAFAQSDWLLPTLLEQRLTSFFQPIVWASDPTNIYAQECLLRAEVADGRVLAAEMVLDAARQARLLSQTDLAARHTAIREVVRHGVENHLFINLAPTCLCDPETCLRSTVRALNSAGIPRSKVIFEITETDEADDVYALNALTEYCRSSDFRVALDDVGSGYSSLNLIHRLRPDFIKLDLDLIRGVDHDSYKATIVQKIIELAHSLDISTIAEGVETSEEMNWIQDHGATFAQGWFIAKPANPPVRDISR